MADKSSKQTADKASSSAAVNEQAEQQSQQARTVTIDDFGGNFTFAKARRVFGSDELAVMAFDAVCGASQCGSFNDTERSQVVIGLPVGDTDEDNQMRERISKALSRVK